MSSRVIAFLCIALASACAIAQTSQKPRPEPSRVSPSTNENLKVESKLLRRGTQVVVNATISKTGEVRNVKFIKGNPDLMPEVRKALRTWKYKPYVYLGHAVEVETIIYVNFDPLTGA
jgi:Gram-negative bacterial TonB protein C-terminal